MKREGVIDRKTVQELARFRYGLRKFLRFSEEAARECGVTPQQHQLMLGIAGFNGSGTATISEMAEFLQEKNHSVVGLVERAIQSGLVLRQNSATDRRTVELSLTARGEEVLWRLAAIHQQELKRMRTGFFPGRGTRRAVAAATKEGSTKRSLRER